MLDDAITIDGTPAAQTAKDENRHRRDRAGARRCGRTPRAVLVGLMALAGWYAGGGVLAGASDKPTFTVSSTIDGDGKDGVLTLREAILLANGGTGPSGLARPLSLAEKLQTSGCVLIGSGDSWSIASGCGAGVRDSIAFDLAGCPCTIAPTTGLPPTTEPVVIDGYSQPGAMPNTDPKASDAILLVTLDGSDAPSGTSGLLIAGGTSEVDGLVVANFGGHGIVLTSKDGNRLRGNRIVQAGHDGILVDSSVNEIGGFAAYRNVIAGCGGHGIEIAYGKVQNQILRNLIGTESNAKDLAGNGGAGISISASATTVFGNVIADNGGSGIDVLAGVRVRIAANRTFANQGLAIDLGADGVTPNDRPSRDADDGANHLQNYPILTRADHVTGKIRGRLVSTPSTTFTVELFASASCDPSGHGEARIYLGSADVATNANGVARFTIQPSMPFGAGNAITATATSADFSTSELSRCRTAK
ncbi:right-handed parallel beta-helix repeat-containing protein [Candidatus Binatia bacterium]|jgi:hypothetical protein|nr:right-handed parallel beta-helix repeat-containing protein [Candidatus Binatia bacterium]